MDKRIIKDEEVSFIEIKNDKNLEVTLCTLGASFYRIVYKGKNRIMTPINHKEFYYNEKYYRNGFCDGVQMVSGCIK